MLINDYWKYMIICLIATIIIEVGISILLKYRKTDLIYILLVQILTNPLLNGLSLFIFITLGKTYKNIFVYISEVLIVLIEGFVYKKCLDKKDINPYKLSLALNASSYVLGLFIGKLF